MYTTIERIRHAAQASAWQAAALKQTPANIWAHHNQPTEYRCGSFTGGKRDNSIYFSQGTNSTVAVASCSAVETPRKHWGIYFGHARVHRLVGRNSSITGPGKAGSIAACTTPSHIVHDARHRSCPKLLWDDTVDIIPTKNRNTHKFGREYGT